MAVKEALEVVTWAAAACRSSAELDRTVHCRPIITSTEVDSLSIDFAYRPVGTDGTIAVTAGESQPVSDLGIKATSTPTTHALCWLQLVRDPAVVDGFPIRRRHSSEQQGLEIDLGVMAMLAQARRAIIFDGVLIVTGLCTMLVAVAHAAGSTMWHFLSDPEQKPLLYVEALKHCSRRDATDFRALDSARHFLGYTRHGHIVAGECFLTSISRPVQLRSDVNLDRQQAC
jgi:hypothetical protein